MSTNVFAVPSTLQERLSQLYWKTSPHECTSKTDRVVRARNKQGEKETGGEALGQPGTFFPLATSVNHENTDSASDREVTPAIEVLQPTSYDRFHFRNCFLLTYEQFLRIPRLTCLRFESKYTNAFPEGSALSVPTVSDQREILTSNHTVSFYFHITNFQCASLFSHQPPPPPPTSLHIAYPIHFHIHASLPEA